MSSMYSGLYAEVGYLKCMDLLELFSEHRHDPVELQSAVHEFIEECDLDASEVDELIHELRGCDIEQMRMKRFAQSVRESFEPYGSHKTYACPWL